MIPVPQPRRPSNENGLPSQTPLDEPTLGATRPSARPSRRSGGRLAFIVAAGLAVILLGVAVAASFMVGLGLDLPLIGLLFGFLFFGSLSFALRFFGDAVPFVRGVRWLLSLLTLAALAGLLYLYAYPAISHNPAWPGAVSDPRPGVSLTKQASVVYSLTGDGGAEISAESPLPSGDVGPQTVDALPYEHSVQLTVNKRTPGLFTLVATGLPQGDDAQLACTITVDGVVIAHDEASGAQRMVFCSGEPQ